MRGAHSRPAPDRFNPRAIIGDMNETQAIDLMRECRRRFNWTGVEFMPGDIDAVVAELNPALSETERWDVICKVTDSRMWRVLLTQRLVALGQDYIAMMLTAVGHA